MFWRKKEIASAEYGDLLSKYMKIEAEVATLKHLFEKLELRFGTLQGQVSRKLHPQTAQSQGLDEEIQKLKQFFGTPAESYAATQGLLNRDTE